MKHKHNQQTEHSKQNTLSTASSNRSGCPTTFFTCLSARAATLVRMLFSKHPRLHRDGMLSNAQRATRRVGVATMTPTLPIGFRERQDKAITLLSGQSGMRNPTLSLVLGLAIGFYTIQTNKSLLLFLDKSNFIFQVACQAVKRIVLTVTPVLRTLVL